MRKSYLFGILLLSLVAIIAGGCKDESPDSLDFYEMAYEVPLHGTRYIGIKSGSGDYSIQVENPGLFSASKEDGWSNPAGMLSVRGLLTGESTLIVTDNQTRERANLKVKVVNNYEVFRVSQFCWSDSTMMENKHPILSKMPFVFLINNRMRDVYFADRSGENPAIGNDIRILGNGTYSFTMENGKPYLTLTYKEDENGQLTDAVSAVSTPHKFEITQSSEFLLHRLNKNLNLGWETSSKDYSSDQVNLVLKIQPTDSDNQLECKLEQIEIPAGISN